MKTIGISYTPVKMANYLQWFERQGLASQVKLVVLDFRQNNREDFGRCNGFILTGGDDIDPAFYNGNPQYPNMPAVFEEARDRFEADIFTHAYLQNKPVLGICRGLQLVNVLMGGSLIQDLGDEDNLKHRPHPGGDQQHDITITPGSLLHRLTHSHSGTVNSAHHQLTNPVVIGNGLMVNSMGNQGEIEGLEYTNKAGRPFLMCVQWHPERMPDQQNPLSKNILKAFVDAIVPG